MPSPRCGLVRFYVYTMNFDPWESTLEDGLAHFSGEEEISEAHMRWLAAREMVARREAIISSGRNVLDAVADCARLGLPLPGWLAAAFLTRHSAVRHCRVPSWDDPQAFGSPYPGAGRVPTRTQLSAMALRDRSIPLLQALFDPAGRYRLPRTAAGYAEAAAKLGLSPKQVRTWLPKTRKNRRGTPSDDSVELGRAGLEWNDPFGLGKSVKWQE